MKKNFKRTLAYLMAVIMLIGVMPAVNVFAAEVVSSGTCGENLTWTLDDEGTLIISGTGEMKNYTDYSYSPWYSEKTSIKNVVINNGVTSIGDYAFDDCLSLTNVTIPDSVTTIGDKAFRGCTGLKNINIPDGVTRIGVYALYACTGLTNITVDENNPNYSSNNGVLFNKDKTELIQYPIGNIRTEYTIPDNVTSIGDYAFFYCSSLTSVTIPDSVTSIGYAAFGYCFSLTSITIPNSVKSIGKEIFIFCVNLTSVILSNSLESIEYLLFGWCISLTNIMIPESITDISDYVFNCCISLTNITIPDSVTSIGELAFYGCISLTNITIPDSVTSIGENAFGTCISSNKIIIRNRELDLTDSGLGYSDWKLKVSKDEFIKLFKQAVFEGNYDEFEASYECLGEPEPMEDMTIYGYPGSNCETYANENGFAFIDIEAPQPHEHSFASSVTKAPTCTEEGIMTYSCSCGESYTEIIAATGNHIDNNNDGECDTCGKDLGTKPSENKSFIEKIKDFFQKIMDWFKNIFK